MCITADTSDACHPKVERQQLEFAIFTIGQPSLLKVWYNEAAEAAIHVKTNIVS